MRTTSDPQEQKVIDDIHAYGVHIVHVMEHPSDPAFSYSVGLFESYRHPEIIIFGLKFELTKILLNNIAFDIKSGHTFAAAQFHEGILDDFLCYFGEVPKTEYPDHVGWGLWLYESDEFPLLQCVCPTVSGAFPWEANFPEEARWNCPLLIAPPAEEAIH